MPLIAHNDLHLTLVDNSDARRPHFTFKCHRFTVTDDAIKVVFRADATARVTVAADQRDVFGLDRAIQRELDLRDDLGYAIDHVDDWGLATMAFSQPDWSITGAYTERPGR